MENTMKPINDTPIAPAAKRQKSASDTHQFQWLLKPFEYGKSFTINVHKILLKRKTSFSFVEYEIFLLFVT
jgi:hypothetical protein